MKDRISRRSIHEDKSREQLLDELTALEESLDELNGSFVLYDSEDRLTFRNEFHLRLFPSIPDEMSRGNTYPEFLQLQAASGEIPASVGREEEWVKEYINNRENTHAPQDQVFSDGRVYRASQHRTPSGGFMVIRADVTDLKVAQEALRKSEEQFRVLAKMGNDWFWNTDADHIFVSFQGYSPLRGLPEEEISGVRRWDNASQRDLQDVEKWDRHKAQLDNREEIRNFEFEQRSDPPEWIRVSGDPVFDSQGNFTGYQGTAAVVTQYKQTELRNNQLIAAFDSLKENIVLFDSDERAVFYNKKFLETNKNIIESIFLGMKVEDHVRAVVEKGLAPEAIGREEEWVQERLERFRNPGEIFEVCRNDGSWIQVREQKLPDGGTFQLGMDITEIKKIQKSLEDSEQRFRDHVESSSDWLWEMDSDLKFTFVSERGAETTGVPVEDMLGKTRKVLFASAKDEEDWEQHLNDLTAHLSFRDFRYSFRHASGNILHFSISGKPVFDESSNFLGYRGTGSDLTSHRRAQQDLQKALVDAERANQAKSEFLATMSHEFRTPLNAILGFSQMLQGQYFGPLGAENYREYADDIHLSGSHMLDLVNDVLDIAAIEAGKRSYLPETFAFDELIRTCLRSIGKIARDKGVELTLQMPESLPLIHIDKRSVTQILQNILSNAVKFTERDGTIKVSVSADEMIIVLVEDTGIGIPAGKLPEITKPFTQGENDPLLSQEGTGLGLAIVKTLVEALGGKLNIESEIDKGTSVSVDFPLKTA